MVRPLSFFSTLCVLAFTLASCAQKSADAPAEAKVDIPKPDNVTAPADSRPIILCYGDSITAGYGLEAGQSYPDVLQTILDGKNYKYRVINSGISGDTTQSGLDRLYDVQRLNPKITLLELGGNDGLRGIEASKTRDNLYAIASGLESRGSKILLIGITLPRNYGPEYIREFENNYKVIASERKYPLMPFILEGVYNQPGMMQADGIHPTAKGAAKVAANVFKYLEPMLTK